VIAVDARDHTLSGNSIAAAGGSKGIGEGIALRLLGSGANVVLIARNVDDLEAAATRARTVARSDQHVLATNADVAS
jgi:NAD(P)-dependent dehydrogenase (short-subunit alcohol dehydrogenase family)